MTRPGQHGLQRLLLVACLLVVSHASENKTIVLENGSQLMAALGGEALPLTLKIPAGKTVNVSDVEPELVGKLLADKFWDAGQLKIVGSSIQQDGKPLAVLDLGFRSEGTVRVLGRPLGRRGAWRLRRCIAVTRLLLFVKHLHAGPCASRTCSRCSTARHLCSWRTWRSQGCAPGGCGPSQGHWGACMQPGQQPGQLRSSENFAQASRAVAVDF